MAHAQLPCSIDVLGLSCSKEAPSGTVERTYLLLGKPWALWCKKATLPPCVQLGLGLVLPTSIPMENKKA